MCPSWEVGEILKNRDVKLIGCVFAELAEQLFHPLELFMEERICPNSLVEIAPWSQDSDDLLEYGLVLQHPVNGLRLENVWVKDILVGQELKYIGFAA